MNRVAQIEDAFAGYLTVVWSSDYAPFKGAGIPEIVDLNVLVKYRRRGIAAALLEAADPERGRFRTFLLKSLQNYLANEWDRARAAKRGGGQALISLDDTDAEERYRLEPMDNMTADKLFDRRWVMTLLEQVMVRLRGEYSQLGNAQLYETLKDSLAGSRESAPYAQLATELKMTEGAVKVAVHRLRARYRELLREEIAQTVAGPGQVGEEGGGVCIVWVPCFEHIQNNVGVEQDPHRCFSMRCFR